MTPVLVNDVIEVTGAVMRVLNIQAKTRRIYLFPMEEKNALPKRWDLDNFQSTEIQRSIRRLPEPSEARPWETSDADKRVAAVRWTRIQGLVSGPRALELLERESRAKLLTAHADLVGTTDRTLMSDLRLWWAGGQKQTALRGRYFSSGKVTHKEGSDEAPIEIFDAATGCTSTVFFAPATQRSRGRRPTLEDYEPLAIPQALRKKILATAEKHYLSDVTRSVRATADHVLRLHFGIRDDKGELQKSPDGKSALLLPPGQRPTLAQIRYMLQKAFPEAMRHSKRLSPADFKNNHADASGSVSDDTAGPGDVYEIDATIVDTHIVAKANRKTILGKATLYLVIDRKTRLIVGFYMSLENASWNEAKLAILSIASDWEALCNRFGVPFDANDWPARGILPNRFVGDRGEMLSLASNVLCDELRIPVTNPPALAARRKCIVEGGFHTTQVALKDNVPGYEPQSNITKRRGKKYDKDATLTLDELTAIYLRAVVYHNTRVMTGYPLSPEEVFEGEAATAANLWRKGIERNMGALPRYDFETLRRALMPVGQATVNQYGIHFQHCTYAFKQAQYKDWVSRASIRGQFTVRVAYSQGWVDEIIVIDPTDGSNQYRAQLTTGSLHFAGYSFAEVKAYVIAKARLDRKGENENTALRIGMAEDIATVTGPAHKEMTLAKKGAAHGSRYRDSTEVRASEARARRVSANSSTEQSTYVVGTLPEPAAVQPAPPKQAPSAPIETTSQKSTSRDVAPGIEDTLLNMFKQD